MFKEENFMNNSSLVRTLLATLVFGGILAAPGSLLWAGQQTDPLDGKTYVGEIGEKGKKEGEYSEEMSFKNGAMVSSACSSLGFTSFPYQVTVKGEAIEFVAEASNPTEGTLKWEGVVKGDTLNATSVWKKAGEPPDESWLTATLKH